MQKNHGILDPFDWDAKSVPSKETLMTSDGGFIQILGRVCLPKIGGFHQIQFEDLSTQFFFGLFKVRVGL